MFDHHALKLGSRFFSSSKLLIGLIDIQLLQLAETQVLGYRAQSNLVVHLFTKQARLQFTMYVGNFGPNLFSN